MAQHRKLLLEWEGEHGWLGLCSDRLLVAEREEPGEEARKGGLSTRAWPEGLPLRGLRVITGEAAGFATAGTLTLGGCAAPLSFPLALGARDGGGMEAAEVRRREWEGAVERAIPAEEEQASCIPTCPARPATLAAPRPAA